MGREKEYVILTDAIKDTIWQALTSTEPDLTSIDLNLAILDKVEPTNEMIVYLGTILAAGTISVGVLKSYKELYKMARTLRNTGTFFPDNIPGFLKAVTEQDSNLNKHFGPLIVGDIKRLVEYKAALLMKEYVSYIDN